VRIRRLKILGVATGLSLVAALLGVVLYSLPREDGPSVNRIADFAALNEVAFWAEDQPWLAGIARFPSRTAENDHVRFVAIDEGSLAPPPSGLGAWPWPRATHGKLLERLAKAGARVVAFDVLFLEPSADPAQDAALARGLRAQPAVLGFTAETTRGGNFSLLAPPPPLASAARGLGFTTVDNAGGWLFGQYFTITPERSRTYLSLAAAAASAYAGVRVTPVDAWHARLGGEEVALDGDGLLTMLPFKEAQHVDQQPANGLASRAGASNVSVPFAQAVSYADALRMSDRDLAAFARGELVVVGPTAQSLGDYIITPAGRYPGAFANLRLIDQLLTGTFVRRVPPWLDLALIVLLPLLAGFAVTQLRPVIGVAIGVALVLLYSALAVAVYGYTLHWMNLIHVGAAVLLAVLLVALYRTVVEGAEKRVIREMFGKHVSPALVDEMLAHDDPLQTLALAGKRVRVTIFYSDIRGFTSMSETMSPEEIYAALNEYFEEMCALVFEHGGYVDKFIGDCVMAVFSAPNPRPNDAYEAVLSAWKQQQRILAMMTEWAAAGRKVFTVGMGMNTGEVVMGNLGSRDRLNYTVIGDNVNTAARLYNVAKGGQIIISESTYEEVKDHFIVNELTPVFVKGKALALRNFEVVGLLKPGEANPSRLLDPENLPAATTADAH
jgi:adenylate cyclase